MTQEREHKPYHERRVEQQALDALLRIEELIKAFLIMLPVPNADGNYEERVTTETKPTQANKGKRR